MKRKRKKDVTWAIAVLDAYFLDLEIEHRLAVHRCKQKIMRAIGPNSFLPADIASEADRAEQLRRIRDRLYEIVGEHL